LAAGGISSLGLALTLFGVWWCVRRNRGPAQASLSPPAVGKPAAVSPSISVRCSGCGKKLKAGADFAGKKVKCPQCGQAVFVPAIKAEAP